MSIAGELTEHIGSFTFVDLFAGLGGFHVGMTKLGGVCVLACEKDQKLRNNYVQNFDLHPASDIRKLVPSEVPDHDVLCAGFPCQSFSKAGSQLGLECENNGDLIYRVIDIIRAKLPTYILLENVANLERHAGGQTWALIRSELERLEYTVDHETLSPHHFSIPQIRERFFIVGSRNGLSHFTWPAKSNTKPSIRRVLTQNPDDSRQLSKQLLECLSVWQMFLDRFPRDKELPSFPIWSMEFGADYPYDEPPANLSVSELRQFKGPHGIPLTGENKDEILAQLPAYARSSEPFPRWKKTFIRQNRNLYEAEKHWLKSWIPVILKFPPSLQKFEWNCKGEVRCLWNHVLQVRASGVRVKRDTTSPSLVAMTTTQVPIIAWEKRYMTPRECSYLQSFPPDIILPSEPSVAYKALGNAVNAELVYLIARNLVMEADPVQDQTLALASGRDHLNIR